MPSPALSRPPLVCGIDLSTPLGSVAVLDTADGREKQSSFRSGYDANGRRRDSSSLCLPALHKLLRAWKSDFKDVDIYCVTTGPGSFTGLRVALATAEGLAFGAKEDVRVTGIGTLEAAALAMRGINGTLISPVFPAGRGEIYGALYECTPSGVRESIPVHLLSPEAWLACVSRKDTVTFVGPAAETLRKIASVAPSWKFDTREIRLALPAARWAAELSLKKKNLPAPILQYVRLPDALLPKKRLLTSPSTKG